MKMHPKFKVGEKAKFSFFGPKVLDVNQYFDQRLDLEPQDKNWIESLSKNCKISCMIVWARGEAHNWSGPFAGNTALCTVRDYREHTAYPLLTAKALVSSQMEGARTSLYNYPHRLTSTIDTQMFIGDQLCSRTKATVSEVKWLDSQLTPQEKIGRNEKIASEDQRALREMFADATLDYPYKIRICGNDDTSWSVCVESLEKAQEKIIGLGENPCFRVLQELGFVFTN